MQLQSETTNTNQNQWNETEIKDLILYAKSLQEEVDTKSAQLIMMQAKLDNEEAKVRRLTLTLKQFMNI
jgi:hypothetical protein